jgi:uncharacterized membrane protein
MSNAKVTRNLLVFGGVATGYFVYRGIQNKQGTRQIKPYELTIGGMGIFSLVFGLYALTQK